MSNLIIFIALVALVIWAISFAMPEDEKHDHSE